MRMLGRTVLAGLIATLAMLPLSSEAKRVGGGKNVGAAKPASSSSGPKKTEDAKKESKRMA